MDKDAIVELLDEYTSGIVGEEEDGAFRVALPRTCEMVGELTTALRDKKLDLSFPATNNPSETLFMKIVPFSDAPKSIPHEVLQAFVWLPNKMGMYSFKKSEMQDMSLHQLFLQLEPNFFPTILEDEPGTDNFYLHVAKKDDIRRPQQQKEKPMNLMTKIEILLPVIVSLFVLFLAFYTEGRTQPLIDFVNSFF